MRIFTKLITAGALLSTSAAYAFMPQTGTWIMTSEQNGKPGRGLAIDVQDNTLVMQMYAYDASGNATFYMTSGAMTGESYTGALNQYRGGRYLGSGDLSGQDNGSAGAIKIRFESGTKGYITLPGEPEKEISRFNFAYGNNPEGLKGIWVFSPLNSSNPISDFVKLERIIPGTSSGNGLITTSNGRFGCEYQVSGDVAGTVICAKVSAAGTLLGGYQFKFSVNEGEGLYVNSAGQHIATMHRVGNRSNTGTGILVKSTNEEESEDQSANTSALISGIEQLSKNLDADN